MSQERTEAIVLRNLEYSETSRIVTFATPDRGRMACLAKGVERAKSASRGLLDTFNHLEIVYYWKDSRGIQTLGETALLNEFRAVKSALDRSAYGAFVLELCDRMMQENEPSEELFATLAGGLALLNTTSADARTHCTWQVLQLLRSGGLAPSVDVCGECGESLPEEPRFSYASGFVCRNCRSDAALSRQDSKTLSTLMRSEDACPAETIVSNGAFTVIRNFARRHVETDFRSTRVIEQLYG